MLYPVEDRNALYCSDLSNLLHFHWLDIFSPFSKVVIKASFSAVLKAEAFLVSFLKAGIYLICGIVKLLLRT